MGFSTEWSDQLDSEEVKRTIARLHVTFLTMGFMTLEQVEKVLIMGNNKAEVYAMNGYIYFYEKSDKHYDRLEQVGRRKYK